MRWPPAGSAFVQRSLRRQRCRPAASRAESHLFLPSAAQRAGAAPGAQAPSVSLLCQSYYCSHHTVHDRFSPLHVCVAPTRKITGRGAGRTSRPFKSTEDTGRHHGCSNPIGQIFESESHTLPQSELEDVALILSHSCLARKETKKRKKTRKEHFLREKGRMNVGSQPAVSTTAGRWRGCNSSQPSVQFSCSVLSDSLRPHGLPHARPPCPSPTPGVYSNHVH